MADIEKVDLASENLVDDRLNKLKELMPEVFTESGIDFDKLRLELGDEVDEGQERYAFTWPGKADAIRQSQTVSTATLRPCPEKSRSRDGEDGSFDSDNIYIEGDNLEVLKLLQRGYHGKVKMIYIDPPYNTGHDFVYKDNFGNSIENYKEQAGLAGQSNADTGGRYHSDWCSMMHPRLRLARELLTDDGVIFISIDDNEIVNLRNLMDEIFGSNNRVAQIALLCNPKGRSQDKYIANCHEYVVIYSKSVLPAGAVSLQKTEEDVKSDYPLFDEEKGPYRELELRNTHREFGKDNRPNLYYPFYVNPNSGVVCLKPTAECCIEVLPDWDDGYQGCWTWGSEKSRTQQEDLCAKNISGRWKIYRKSFAFSDGEVALKQVKSIWQDKAFFTERGQREFNDLFKSKGKLFQSPKSPEMIKQTILMGATESSLILDFFAGSSTTAQAVIDLNSSDGGKRRCISVQIPELVGQKTDAFKGGYVNLCDIGEERIRRAGNKVKAEVEEENAQPKLGGEPKNLPDIGFRVFALDDSGIERPKPGQLVLDVVKPDRTELDIVFEMMLKWGLELTLPVEKSDAAGYPIWSVACDELVCCMSRGLTIEALEAIADMEPRRVLILDSVLDDTLKLNAVQIFKHAGERMGCEIELRTV